MDCRRTQSVLSQYVADDLSTEERQCVWDHLQACAACRAGYELHKAMEHVLCEPERAPMPRRTQIRIWVSLLVNAEGRLPVYAGAAVGVLLGLILGLSIASFDSTVVLLPVLDSFPGLLGMVQDWAGAQAAPLFSSTPVVSASQAGAALALTGLLCLIFLKCMHGFMHVLVSIVHSDSRNGTG